MVLQTAYRFAQRHRTALGIALVLALAALGFSALRAMIETIRIDQIEAAVASIGPAHLLASGLFAATSYFALTFYDVLALRVIGRSLPYRTAALASFTSYTLSNNLGLSLLTGGSARYRFYSTAGLETPDIARVMFIASTTFWAGVCDLAGLGLSIHPFQFTEPLAWFGPTFQRAVGILVLLTAGAALIRISRGPITISIGGWTIPAPSLRQAGSQIAIAAVDLSASCLCLLVLIPGAGPALFPTLLLAYILANIVALLTHVPGGLGVFEAVIVALLPELQRADLIAALLVYRVIYYFLPLAIAAIVLGISTGGSWRRPISSMLSGTQSIMVALAPTFVAVLCLLGGGVLLIAAALPAETVRLETLRRFIPLPFVEASHIAASLVGTGLLILVPPLHRRLDGAFIAARALLLAGAIFSLFRGSDYTQVVVLLGIAALLQWTRPAFYRRTALTENLPGQWLTAVLLVVMATLWTGFFAYRRIPYENDLWWEFAWKGDASRFLRASFAVSVMLVIVLLERLFRPARSFASAELTETDDDILAAATRTDAMLLFTGDKKVLHSRQGDALLMYQIQGQSWIVMGDPVGPENEWEDLLWQIREMADARQGRLLLYQVSAAVLPIAVDLGLQLMKYGEEARIDLSSFSLEGPTSKQLRYAVRRAEREGAQFEVVSAALVPGILPEMQKVSDDWLRAKRHREKAFSIGRFDESYMARFDCAVIRHEGRIVAFANVWATCNREELSIDLMRHTDELPYGAMDYLFVNLIQWGQQRGYRWFALGLAPLSGIEPRRLAPLWARAANFLYRHGDSFYGFEGLRAYKEKFSPIWEPRYIATASGASTVKALVDLQTLIGGGRSSAAIRGTAN